MKKIIQILLICLMISGIIVIATAGFNVGLKYSENTQINVQIDKEFDIKDIKQIVDDVFGKNKSIVQAVELYKDMAQITVKEINDEQLESLNAKINEKYDIENKVEDLVISYNANTKLRDLAKSYIWPIVISAVIILAYEMIRFNKQGVWKVLYKSSIAIIAPQAVLFSLYAVARIPINRWTSIISLTLYIISVCYGIRILVEEKEKPIEE